MGKTHERRLSAIMIADIAGFSRLMELDESRTFARVRQVRDEITNPRVAEHGGRIIKTTGDGFLAEFASSIAALRCGIDIQRSIIALQADQPREAQIRLRIGINIGDIIIDGDDIAGDGVNVAARLEAMAPPDGLCISSMVHDQIRDDLGVVFKDLGEQQLKNISRPVRAFVVTIGDSNTNSKGLGAHRPAGRGARSRYRNVVIVSMSAFALALALTGWYWQRFGGASNASTAQRPVLSIAVLPFANGTGDPQQSYIADGLTASITSDLSRIRDAFVVAAANAFPYKDKPANLQQLGNELGVRFVLQGSVQRGGDMIRINAQLADTQTRAQLWTETFEGSPSNLFALQDMVTARISNSIGREMVVVAARESESRAGNPQATDLLLRARAAELKPQSPENLEQIEGWYRQVLDLDPNSTTALAGLARSLVVRAFNFGDKLGPEMKEKKFVEGRDLALRAKEIDPRNSMIYGVLALYASTHDDYPGNRRASETWLSLDPKNPIAYNFVANMEIYRLKAKEAIALLDQATALDPKHPSVLSSIT